MHMLRNTPKALVFGTMLMALAACKKEDPVTPPTPTPPVNEQEVITTLLVRLESTSGGDVKLLQWRDLDGPGGNDPVISSDTLTAGVVYNASIEVLDESDPNNVKDITEEISEESAEHQFFFIVSGSNVTVAYNDADGNGAPIGLSSVWTAGTASEGTVTVILRHEPDKGAAGVSDGDITNAGGDTDIEVSFPVVIQ